MDVVFTVIYGIIIELLRKNSRDVSGRVGWQWDTPAGQPVGSFCQGVCHNWGIIVRMVKSKVMEERQQVKLEWREEIETVAGVQQQFVPKV